MDDISRLQCALQNGDVSLRIKKSQNILPVKEEGKEALVTRRCMLECDSTEVCVESAESA